MLTEEFHLKEKKLTWPLFTPRTDGRDDQTKNIKKSLFHESKS